MSGVDYTAVAAELFEAEGKLLQAASAAGNAQMALGPEGAAAYLLVRAIDEALVEVRVLQAAYAGDEDATGL